MASSSSNPDVRLEVREEYLYPYPSHVCAPNFVTLKLSGRDKYNIWKRQMLCLLESHGMLGFIDGTLVCPQTSASAKEKVDDHQARHRLWRRSDTLVQGWILGALSEETLTVVVDRLTERLHREESNNEGEFTAKDLWDELQKMHAPPALPKDKQEEIARDSVHEQLHEAILGGHYAYAEEMLRTNEVTVVDKISYNGNTALHLAVSDMNDEKFLKRWLEMIPEGTQVLDVRNSDGSTPLHVAAIVGNLEAAKILVEKDPDLLLAKDNEGQTPLLLAFSNMHTETAQLLLQHINTDAQKEALFSGASGDELLVTVISSKDFSLARKLLEQYESLYSDVVLMAIAQNFPSTPNQLVLYIGSGQLKTIIDDFPEDFMDFISCLPRWLFLVLQILLILLFGGFYWIIWLLTVILEILVRRFTKEFKLRVDAGILLDRACHRLSLHLNYGSDYYTNAILEATRRNAVEAVSIIISWYPNAMLSADKNGHTTIQYAVIHRSQNVYSLLLQWSEHRNIYRTLKDSSGNSLLHLAARLAPSNKLNLISGAALQIQRELQWFEEVKGFVCPLTIMQKNSSNETPQMVFTREHKELVMEGEKWMKATAESYTITAALIITIVFAAAITVPGGNNQDTGVPIFTNKTAFTIFAISDAISLFTAVTSLFMFLSILTARFAEQDFLFKLPTKLMIGLTTLFISTTAMIVAFSATLYLVFGQSNSWILIPIALLTCLPITSFVTLQFPLILDLMNATYGRSIFGKKIIRRSWFFHSLYA